MKFNILGMFLIVLTVACTAAPTAIPTPAPAPVATAAPTLAASVPPTRIPTPNATATAAPPSAPTVRERFVLRDLPGVGKHPAALAFSGDKLYALNTESENLAVIQNERVTKFIPLAKRPSALAADPAQNRLYVANADAKSLTLFVNEQSTRTINTDEEIRALLFFENRLFAGSSSKGMILVLEPSTLQIEARITVPSALTIVNLVGDALTHRVYANVYNKTAVIDAPTLRMQTILPTDRSYYTLVAPPGNAVFVTTYEANTNTPYLVAFDPVSGAMRGRVKVGSDPRASIASADGARVYVANAYTNDVTVIDPRALSVVATIPVGIQPSALALDEKARRLYVANADSANIHCVDTQTNQVVATVPLGILPTQFLANENAGRMYIANASTDSVFVVEGARLVKEIAVGRHPLDLARDPQTNRVFVANAAENTVTVIDEASFAARATQPITRGVTTVAVDRGRLFAGSAVLDANTFASVGSVLLRGYTIGSTIAPEFLRFNASGSRLYALGWNGVPGSNSRTIAYSLDPATWQQRNVLSFNGNASQLALDPDSQRVFIAGTHPLAYSNELGVYDLNDTRVYSLTLSARTVGMIYNPQTRHLFLAQAQNYAPAVVTPTALAANNTMLILDATSFGQVALLEVKAPGKLGRLGNTIYVANRDDGSLTLIQDVAQPVPPAPTPTFTRTPYPSATQAVAPGAPSVTRPLAATPTMPLACGLALGSLATPRLTPNFIAQFGCPLELERVANFATQKFEGGQMFWREDTKQISVLLNDKSWAQFEDTWSTTQPEDACPAITVTGGQKPKRGFGKVWCEQANVRTKLGAATANEVGVYAALVQRFERGQLFASVDRAQVFALFANGRWE